MRFHGSLCELLRRLLRCGFEEVANARRLESSGRAVAAAANEGETSVAWRWRRRRRLAFSINRPLDNIYPIRKNDMIRKDGAAAGRLYHLLRGLHVLQLRRCASKRRR